MIRAPWALLLCGCTAHAFCTAPSAGARILASFPPPARAASWLPSQGLLVERQYMRSEFWRGHGGMALAQRARPGMRGGGAVMSSAAAGGDPEDPLVMYLVVRADLAKDKGWPLGSVIAQGAHAATKALWEDVQFQGEDNVKEYCSPDNIDRMYKVVLSAKSEKQLRNAADTLEEQGLKSCLWMEQPENEPTALAVMPYPRSVVKPALKKFQLMK